MGAFLSAITRSFRVADAIDILVGAVIAYSMISWFRKTRSRFVVIGFGVLAALYFGAQLLGMRLTLTLFQAVIAGALFALVVVFQEDIRRGFEQVGLGSRLKGRLRTSASDSLVDVISNGVTWLVEHRLGALIVLPGAAPIQRHVTGGIALSALPSEPLLWSIFDPHSPGHDGALIVESGRFETFAVRLPLSARPGSRLHGTRHAAARGLSELCDAFIIAVSEERGTITIATSGDLEVVSAGELRGRLEAFLEPAGAPAGQGGLRRAVVGDLRFKALSLAIAVAAWYAVSFGPRAEGAATPGSEATQATPTSAR